MTSATLRRARGDVIIMPRVILIGPTAISYVDAAGVHHRQEWSPNRDKLSYPSPGTVIRGLEGALARATGQTIHVVRLQHGYDLDSIDRQ